MPPRTRRPDFDALLRFIAVVVEDWDTLWWQHKTLVGREVKLDARQADHRNFW
jgi:hypothetical protein